MGPRGVILASTLAGCASAEDLDQDGVLVGADCNDADPVQTAPDWLYVDADGDGAAGDTREIGCPGNPWLFPEATDCDDSDATIHPGQPEIGCDARDNDCDPDTADGPAITVGATWSTVQSAIDSAGYGEVVLLCASTVKEDVVVHRPIELVGAGMGLTVIEGAGGGTALQVTADGSRVVGLTVRGGVGLVLDGRTVGGGVLVAAEDVALEEIEVTDNHAVDGGGIAVLPGASLTLDGAIVHDNSAVDRGGGLYAEDAATLEVIGSVVSANVALEGGGLWLRGSATFSGAEIADNNADLGGGVLLDSSLATSNLVGVGDAVLRGNAAVAGGGVYGAGDLVGITIEGNDADDGGGIYAIGAVGLFQSTLADNRALALDGGAGGGVMLPPGTSLVASEVAMLGNTAVGWGGALHADTASIVLFGAQLESNVADQGGGMAIVGSCPTCMLEGSALELRANEALTAGGDLLLLSPLATLGLSDVLLHAATAPRGASISIVAGTVELQDAEVSGTFAVEPDNAAIELGLTGAALLVTGGLFMGNDPADVRVVPFAAEPAPGPDFSCASGTGCGALPP